MFHSSVNFTLKCFLCTPITGTDSTELLMIPGSFQEKWFTKCILHVGQMGKINGTWSCHQGVITKVSSWTTLICSYFPPPDLPPKLQSWTSNKLLNTYLLCARIFQSISQAEMSKAKGIIFPLKLILWFFCKWHHYFQKHPNTGLDSQFLFHSFPYPQTQSHGPVDLCSILFAVHSSALVSLPHAFISICTQVLT